MQSITRGLVMASLIAVGASAFARPAPQMTTLNGKGTVYPISAQRVDRNGNLVGPVFDLRNARSNQGATETANPWRMAWDSSNANPNFVDLMNPGPETPAPFQSFYGANQPLWWFGASYNNPYVVQDLTTIAPGQAGDVATGFTFVASFNSALMDPLSNSITIVVGTSVSASTTVAPSSSGFLDAVALTYDLDNSAGAWSLGASGLAAFGLGVPIPQNGGALEVAIGRIVSGNFVALPFAGQLNFGSMLASNEGIASVVGTNPSSSSDLQWDDDSPSDFVHINAELYSYTFGSGNDPGSVIGTKVQGYAGMFSNVDDAKASGTISFLNYGGDLPAPFVVEMVAVDGAGNPVIVGGNALAIDRWVALDAMGQYKVLNPKLSDGVTTYDRYILSVKGSHWLRRNSGVVNLATSQVVNLAMVNGDVNDDNEIGPGDFSALAAAFGSFLGDPNYSEAADLNGDEEVGPADFSILAGNFGEFGDEDYTP